MAGHRYPDRADPLFPLSSMAEATPQPEKTSENKNSENKATKAKAADQSASAKAPAKSKPAAKAKKEKPPKVEDKPFDEFIQQHYLPQVTSALKEEGLADIELSFTQKPFEVVGAADSEPYWQVIGQWDSGQRQFQIGFLDEDIKGQKIFSYSDSGAKPSTIEQFMGDERRITLELLVMYTVQRLNGQKWLTRN